MARRLATTGGLWLLAILPFVSACGDDTTPVGPTDPSTFRVTAAQTSVDSATWTGACPHTFTFTGTITANMAGTITYRWERSDGTTGAPTTLTFAAAGSQTQTTTWPAGATMGGYVRLRVLGPNEMLSNQATFSLTCTAPAFAVTAASVTVDRATATGTCPLRFVFTASMTANAAGSVTYQWERSEGPAGATETMTFGNAGTQTVTATWDRTVSGSAWAQVRVLTPGVLVSNQAAITATCQ